MTPEHPLFRLPYQEIHIPIQNSQDYLHCWFIHAPDNNISQHIILPEEPVNILQQPKTILYFTGAGHNKGDYTKLARMEGFRQLGFSVFTCDYRGYGYSQGHYPQEQQFYKDARLTWYYLTQTKGIAPKDIIIYGESLGGAIAIDLAAQLADVGGVIIQSSFTSMSAVIKQLGWFRYMPVKWMLTERFNSIEKVKSIKAPILFLHGIADDLIPVSMSEQLYRAATKPKRIFLIPEGGHTRIYRSGRYSYLKAIQQFVNSLPYG